MPDPSDPVSTTCWLVTTCPLVLTRKPVPVWVKSAVDSWMVAADVTEGRVFRAVSRHGTAWGKGVSENVVWHMWFGIVPNE